MANECDSILIVEDHNDSAHALSNACAACFPDASIIVVQSFISALAFIENSSLKKTPTLSLALIDIGLPDGNGTDLIRPLNTSHPNAICIITTIFDDDDHLLTALRAGASGYLLKGHSVEELARYLKEALSGQPALSPSIARSVLLFTRTLTYNKLALPEQTTSIENNNLLTDREIEILQVIAKGYSVKEASRLLGISSNTTSVHIKSIYRKLGINNRVEAVTAAQRLSLC